MSQLFFKLNLLGKNCTFMQPYFCISINSMYFLHITVYQKSLVGQCTVNKVNVFFLDVENNSKNVETKFHGRRISVYEVIKSVNVNFLFFWSIFFVRSMFAFLLFLRDSTL